jgi:hypothetical protein
MSKSLVEQLLNLWAGIFRDAAHTFPHLKDDFERDLDTIFQMSDSHGVQGLILLLPKIGKHLDRCVTNSCYVQDCSLPFTGAARDSTLPIFLGGLYAMVFESDGMLKEHPDVEAYLFLRQVLYLAKKLELPCPEECVRQTVEAFFETDRSLPEPTTGFWDDQVPDERRVHRDYRGFSSPLCGFNERLECAFPGRSGLFGRYLDFVFGYLTTTLGRYDAGEWRSKHGPGAIAAKSGPVNKYHWYSWPSRLDSRFPISEHGYYSYSSFLRNFDEQNFGDEEESSRLCAVPKTIDKPRLIAVEPSSHQWCQQNMWHYFCDRVQKTWIGGFVQFRDQTLNQTLCKNGSVDGSLATLDLSEASDRVTCDLVGEMFRRNPTLLCHLAACRTRFVRVDSSLGRDWGPPHKLRKFATMGSACTFPVESLAFLGISMASVLYARRLPMRIEVVESLRGEVGVFGDDIVIPVDAWDTVHCALSALCFKVNTAKSFGNGSFRESCGVDAWRGVDVTPVYLRRAMDGGPESVASTLDSRNNLYKRFYLNACEILERSLEESFPRVPLDSGVTGLLTFQREGRLPQFTKLRYNRALQRREAWLTCFNARVEKHQTDDDSLLHQFFIEQPPPGITWTAGFVVSSSTKMSKKWVPIESLKPLCRPTAPG